MTSRRPRSAVGMGLLVLLPVLLTSCSATGRTSFRPAVA
jgi:hypothetical protein